MQSLCYQAVLGKHKQVNKEKTLAEPKPSQIFRGSTFETKYVLMSCEKRRMHARINVGDKDAWTLGNRFESFILISNR